MVVFTFVVCAEPYKFEAIDTLLNLANAVLRRDHTILGIFFYGSGVYNVKSNINISSSMRNLPKRLEEFIRNNKLIMVYPENMNTRSQDLEDTYHDAGQFYWVNAKRFLEKPILYSDDAMPVILPRYLVQDIDTIEDWKRAEFMYAALKKEKIL